MNPSGRGSSLARLLEYHRSPLFVAEDCPPTILTDWPAVGATEGHWAEEKARRLPKDRKMKVFMESFQFNLIVLINQTDRKVL